MAGIGGIAGDVSQKDTRLEVHHIDPMNGKDRTWNKKNIPENLICLCHKCHWQKHNEIFAERNQKKLSKILDELNAKYGFHEQLTLF